MFETNQKCFTTQGTFKEMSFAAREFKDNLFFILDDETYTPELKGFTLVGVEEPVAGQGVYNSD